MIFDGMEAKAAADANTEILGDVIPILLDTARGNAAQMRLIAQSFERMASEFRTLACDAEKNNSAILAEFEDQAKKLEAQAKQMPRQSVTKALLAVAAKIRAATTRSEK